MPFFCVLLVLKYSSRMLILTPTASQHNMFDSRKKQTIFFAVLTDGIRTFVLWILSPTLYPVATPSPLVSLHWLLIIGHGTEHPARHCEGSKKKTGRRGRHNGGKTTPESGRDCRLIRVTVGLWKTDRQTDRQTDRLADRQTGRQAGRQAGR